MIAPRYFQDFVVRNAELWEGADEEGGVADRVRRECQAQLDKMDKEKASPPKPRPDVKGNPVRNSIQPNPYFFVNMQCFAVRLAKLVIAPTVTPPRS